MRPGQQNKRGRNRHRSGGGGGGGGGGNHNGNPLSRIYESNGPDVKVRGTAQTVAEKYLQLGRDAQSASDIVMAESYYQYAEHYLRIVAAAQAYQQQMQPQFRRPEDGEQEGDETQDATPAEGRTEQASEQPDIAGQPFEPDRQQQHYRPQRDYRDREQQGHYGNRDRNRSRWQDRRNDQAANGDTRPMQPRYEDQSREQTPTPPARDEAAADPGRWEAPSFLRRPAPVPQGGSEEMAADTPARKPRPERKPRRDETAAEGEAGPAEPSTVD